MWHLVHAYTQTQALDDGTLVQIPQPLLKEAGITFPAVMTSRLHSLLTPTDEDIGDGQSFEGRLWDVLMTFRVEAIRNSKDFLVFRCEIRSRGIPSVYKLYAHFGPDDRHQPLVTFMLPEDW